MRVLWTHNFDPDIQGSGVFVHTTARGIRARGIDLQLEYVGNLRSVSQILRARKRIREMAPDFDIVHAQYGSACAVVTAAAYGVPKVLTIRGSDWQVHRSSMNFLNIHTRLASMLTRASIGGFDFVTPVSNRISTELSDFVPADKLEVVPSPVDLSRFVPLDKRIARFQLGFPDNDERWVLFNARDLGNPIKRFELAKQAFDIAQARLGNLRLRIATKLPHEEIPVFVAACDLVICTSDNEGWPNSIKEALACNVPFVATDVGDLKEISRAEQCCRVCPADAEVLADNICNVLNGEMPQDLRKYVRNMSLDSISEQFISIYQSVISQSANTAA